MVLSILFGGCAPDQETTADGPEPDSEASLDVLTGTEWRLVEFQSMSDEIGTIRPDDPSLYTLSFGADGTVSLRLNCNMGNGSWSSTPSSPGGGAIDFGPIATTRALCPPPSMDQKIARDLDFVRSYTIEGDRLFLSMMADAGIYVWQRQFAGE
jgi:heat shock protein HslJ